jgi:hypothetical protein
MNRSVRCLALALALSACATSPAMHAAETGDYATIRTEIGARQKAGNLSNSEARSIAIKLIIHEIEVAKGDDAIKRIEEARACTPDFGGVLEKRMETHDPVGAEAARILYEDGKLQGSEARAFLDDADDRWRAVGTGALVRDIDGPRRRQAMADPSPLVRRAAISASTLSDDQGDANQLFETARLDPDPFVKTYALRALALLAGDRRPDGKATRIAPEIALRFVDLWVGGDDALREDVASELAISPLYEAGGRERLRTLLAQGHGPGVIAGAAALARRSDLSKSEDKDLSDEAVGILSRSIDSGSRRERLHAIATAPLFPTIVEALKKAKEDDDENVKLAVLARLTLVAPERVAALKGLESIAGKKDHEELAARARLALATAGDLRVQAWIEEDLTSKNPTVRMGAVTALAALGRPARGAIIFGDEDVSIRTRAACMIAASARSRQ